MKSIRGRYLLAAVCACCLMGASLGLLVNVIGVFFTPMAEDLGVGRGSVALSLTIATLVYAFGGLVAPRFVRVSTYKKWLVFCTATIGITTVLISFCRNLILIYLLYGIRGFAAGFTGPVLMSVLVNNWFYERSGLINSIAMGFSGLVGAIFSPILTSIITASDWRIATLANAAFLVLMYLPAIILPVGYIPETQGLQPYGAENAAGDTSPDHKPLPILPVLIVLLTAYACIGPFVTAYPPHFPGIGDNYGFPAAVGATMLSICMFTNSGGKILFGFISEKMGSFRSILLYAILGLIGLLLLLLFHTQYTLYIGAALIGAVYCLGSTSIVLATRDLVGLNNYNNVYPKVYTGAIITNALSGSIVGFMYDGTGNYRLALSIASVLMMIMVMVLILAYHIRKTRLLNKIQS